MIGKVSTRFSLIQDYANHLLNNRAQQIWYCFFNFTNLLYYWHEASTTTQAYAIDLFSWCTCKEDLNVVCSLFEIELILKNRVNFIDFSFSLQFIFTGFCFRGSWENPRNSRNWDSKKMSCITIYTLYLDENSSLLRHWLPFDVYQVPTIVRIFTIVV